jgi:hypothetical protein
VLIGVLVFWCDVTDSWRKAFRWYQRRAPAPDAASTAKQSTAKQVTLQSK